MTQATTSTASEALCGVIVCAQPADAGGYCVDHREDQNERHREYRAEHVRSQRRFWLEEIGEPTRYWGASLVDRLTPSIARMREYLDQRGIARGRAVFLASATGTGKTHGACALINECLPYLRTRMRFYLCAQLVRELGNFDTADEAMETAARCRLLVLDDLQIPPRPEALGLLEELLVRRESEGLPLLVTTNLRRAQFEAGFGDRISDRLRARGAYHELSGRSLRGGGA